MAKHHQQVKDICSGQNLTNGQVITIKIPILTPAAANSTEMDDIVIKGSRTPRPITGYEGANQLFLRIREN